MTNRIDHDLAELYLNGEGNDHDHDVLAHQMAIADVDPNASPQDLRVLGRWREELGVVRFGDWLSWAPGLPRTVSYLRAIGDATDAIAPIPGVYRVVQSKRSDLTPAAQAVLEPWDQVDDVALRAFSEKIHTALRSGSLPEAWDKAQAALDLLECVVPDIVPPAVAAEVLEQCASYRRYFPEHLSASIEELRSALAS